ncbi:hypothetical protein RJ640_001976 [Escallonia rubra]|uniref:GAG-pre-integrase domain-containing protein n=1 Tax=Escallonia rubra TaxID=112253 RepID=A0AA88UPT3_9ASTE|nr:hypothetical protein RJ640_001976 [Escallonia rubra]
MSEHLRVMSNMIGKLRDVGHALTDEQQVRAVIRFIPASWANMKHILTHSESIKDFSDVSQHVILEAETRDTDKTFTYVAQMIAQCKWEALMFSFLYKGNKLDIFLDDVLFGHGFRMNNLFQLDLIDSQSSYSYVVNDNIVNDSTTWHARLGHIGQDRMTRLARECLLGPLAKVNLQTCEACLAGYVHSTSHKYGKLGPRAKKSIFLKYSENSKGYVMYGEHPNGGRTEIESRDVDFIESHFPSIGDASKNLDLYELEEVEPTLPSQSEGGELVPHPGVAEDSVSDPQPSGSIPDSGSTPQGSLGQQDSQLRRGARGRVPHRHFEIDGEILMCTPNDEDEPTSMN